MTQKPPEALEAWTGLAKQTAEQITGRTQDAMTNYFTWLQTGVALMAAVASSAMMRPV